MADAAHLIHDIRTLREHIAVHWQEVDELALSDKEQANVRLQITLMVDDLTALKRRLDGSSDAHRTILE